MISCSDERVQQKVAQAGHLWLFLDYDGTLSDFAATPDEINPDEELIALIELLAGLPDSRITIISGRRLAHIQALLPVSGILKAGTYGLELQTTDGQTIHQVDYGTVRPLLDDLKQEWEQLLDGRNGFYLEDKGWTIAIHGKDAIEEEATAVLRVANRQAQGLLEQERGHIFRLLGGHRFLECGPKSANKKRTVEYLLSTFPWHDDALLVYLGDDDKDEVAFEEIQQRGGIAIAVGERLRNSSADCWLPSPQAVRLWLQGVIKARV
ncbi:MAG: trehalose-phosphatase [Chloroflexi bacterium]|jgi:trehalose 6-phosphate phosphatase|nr:trehalose-phosphatase [Chloroflexota bacterium]